MGLLSRLLGNGETQTKIVDSAIAAGDKLFYTQEEKAENSASASRLWVEFYKHDAPPNVARRLIALSVTAVFLLIVVSSFGLGVLGSVLASPSYLEASEYGLRLLSDVMAWPFTATITYYFGKGILQARNRNG